MVHALSAEPWMQERSLTTEFAGKRVYQPGVIHNGHYLWLFDLSRNQWALGSSSLLDQNDLRVALGVPSDSLVNPPRFLGANEDWVFISLSQHKDELFFPIVLAVNLATGMSREVIRGERFGGFRQATIVGDQLIISYGDGSSGSRTNLLRLNRWLDAMSAPVDELDALVEGVRTFYLGAQYLLVVNDTGQVQRYPLP
ncbi:MAG: hypothetical protein MK135_15020 [Polyangiaceae bacterium]|nr:hypothetical protein [Polyangiaceae bacterium]